MKKIGVIGVIGVKKNLVKQTARSFSPDGNGNPFFSPPKIVFLGKSWSEEKKDCNGQPDRFF